MKNKSQQFKLICDKMLTTYERKNHDYGDSFSKTLDEFGLVAASTRMYDKLERFIRLSNRGESMVADESLEDTLLDLANYAIMTVMYIKDSKNVNSKQRVINFV